MNEFNKIAQLARTKLTFWVTVFLVSVEAFYTYVLIKNVSPVTGNAGTIQAAAIAVLIDLSVLIFTIRGRHDYARLYFVLMLFNILLAEIGPAAVWLHWAAIGLIAFEVSLAVYLMSFLTVENAPEKLHRCECGRDFETQQAHAAHKRHCKVKSIAA